MASASSRSLQLGVRRCCVAVSKKTIFSSSSTTTFSISSTTRAARVPAPTARQAGRIRSFSSTALCRAQDDSEDSNGGRRKLDPYEIELQQIEKDARVPLTIAQLFDKDELMKFSSEDILLGDRQLAEMRRALSSASRPDRKLRDQFWNDEEEDPEMVLEESPDDDDATDEMTEMAHSKLDEVRDQRNLARVIAWEMPLLASKWTDTAFPLLSSPHRLTHTHSRSLCLGHLHC